MIDDREGQFDEDLDDDVCDHEERDVDILMGRATCWLCGHRWWLTDAELQRLLHAQAAYDAMCEEEARALEQERD